MASKAHTRQRKIIFPDTITNSQFDSINEKLVKHEHIIDYEMTDEFLLVNYNLKQTSFNEIWAIVSTIMLQNQYPAFTWWKYNFLSRLEANEKDHLVNRFGWYEYIADIFAGQKKNDGA
ncbi:MAG: hypothetical protein HKN08_01160 [Gammaproteobacteria bacterium]|nr:hypothetical protein [Gammaproteobacteria bacterium]